MSLFSESYPDQVKHILSKIEKQLAKNDHFSASFSYQALAKLAEDKGLLDEAIKYTQLAGEYSSKENKFHTSGWHYKALAELYFKKQEYSNSVGSALKSADLLLKEKNIYAAQWSYNLAARASEIQGEIYTAIRYYKKSLELATDDQITQEIERLKKKISHPLVIESVSKKELIEGDQAEFNLTIENNNQEVLKNVAILDSKNNILESLEELLPNQQKTSSFKMTATVGFLKPGYRKIRWENVYGDSFEQDIDPETVKAKPKVYFHALCNSPFRLNKPADFIILLKNNSITGLKHVEFSAKFPDSLKIKPETKTHFEKISPGEEKGCVFSIVPLVIGESRILDIKAKYSDEFGNKYEELSSPITLREILEQPVTENIPGIGNHLKSIGIKTSKLNLSPYPISEHEYITLTKSYISIEKGFTLSHISADHLVSHVLDACEPMALIASREFEEEKLFLFSGINLDNLYLLTICVRQENNLVNVFFKLYSNKKEEAQKMLDAVSEIVSYSSMVLSSAKEVEKIEINQVIKIIDSIVQRSQIGSEKGAGSLKIKDSVIQKSDV